MCVVSADITISDKLFHTFTILGAKQNFLKSLHLSLCFLEIPLPIFGGITEDIILYFIGSCIVESNFKPAVHDVRMDGV